MNIVQIVDNEGPNPGNTQLPGGLDTTIAKPLTPGNAFFGIITCATFGGKHTSEAITDSDANDFVIDNILTGGQGNLSQDQQTILYHVLKLKGDGITADKIHQQFVGGDLDYQALLGVELPPSNFVGSSAYAQNGMAQGKQIVNSGAMIQVPNVPATGFGVGFNISELGAAGSITPVPSAPAALVKDLLAFYEPQGNNVALSQTEITKAGTFRASFDNNSTVPGECFHTFAIVFTPATAVVTPPLTSMVINLTAAQSANLAAGGSLVINGKGN